MANLRHGDGGHIAETGKKRGGMDLSWTGRVLQSYVCVLGNLKSEKKTWTAPSRVLGLIWQ